MNPRPPAPILPPRGQINSGRWEAVLRKFFGVKTSGLLKTIDENVQTGFDLALQEYDDLLGPGGVTPWSAIASNNAGAGNRTIFWFLNPASSGLLVTVKGAIGSINLSGAAVQPQWFINDTPSALNPSNAVPRDSRWIRSGLNPPRFSPILCLDNVATATGFTTYFGAPVVNSQIYFETVNPAPAAATLTYFRLPFPVVLRPGTALAWDSLVANLTVALSLFGTFRSVTSEELSIL